MPDVLTVIVPVTNFEEIASRVDTVHDIERSSDILRWRAGQCGSHTIAVAAPE